MKNVPLSKDDIDLLQTPACRLGICEIDHRQETSVDHGEKQISAPPDIADHDRRDHDYQEIE